MSIQSKKVDYFKNIYNIYFIKGGIKITMNVHKIFLYIILYFKNFIYNWKIIKIKNLNSEKGLVEIFELNNIE